MTAIRKNGSLSVLVLFLLFCFIAIIALVRTYPPMMLVGLDALVIGGFIVIPIAAGKAWRYEIKRIGKIMHDIEHHLEEFKALDSHQQEEYEQYHILKSTEQSINTLEAAPGELTKEQKKQLRYLKLQNHRNKLRLMKRGIIWTFRSLHPKRSVNHPSVFTNIHTIFTNDQFEAIRHALVIWLLLSLIIGYIALVQ